MSQETKIEQTENNLFKKNQELYEALTAFEQKSEELNNECWQNIERLGIGQFEVNESKRIEENGNSYRLYIDQVDKTFAENVEQWRKTKFDARKSEHDELVKNIIQAEQEAERYKNTPEEEYSDKRLKKEARQCAACTNKLLPMHIVANIIGLCLLIWLIYSCVTTSLASESLLSVLANPITWGSLCGMALLAIVMYIWGYKSEYAWRAQIRKQKIANYATDANNAKAIYENTLKAIADWEITHADIPTNNSEWLAKVTDIKIPRAVADQLLQNTINSIDPNHKHWDYRFQINYNGQDCI